MQMLLYFFYFILQLNSLHFNWISLRDAPLLQPLSHNELDNYLKANSLSFALFFIGGLTMCGSWP